MRVFFCPGAFSGTLAGIALFLVTLFGLAVIVVMSLFLCTVIWHLLVLRCPFVPTTRETARAMVRFAGLQGTERVYDLGAGDGAVLIEAVRQYPNLRATGIERVFTVRWWGRLRMLAAGVRVDLRPGDIFKTDVSDADVILLYLVPHIMESLGRQFDRQLRPGTVVVSNTFRFPGREPIEEWHEGRQKLLKYRW